MGDEELEQISRMGRFSLSELTRILAIAGLGGLTEAPRTRPSKKEGSEEPVSFWSRSDVFILDDIILPDRAVINAKFPITG